MSDAPSTKCSCEKNPQPFRLPFLNYGSAQATTCPADGFVVFMPDAPIPGVYVTRGGKFRLLPDEDQICELIKGAVKTLVGGA